MNRYKEMSDDELLQAMITVTEAGLIREAFEARVDSDDWKEKMQKKQDFNEAVKKIQREVYGRKFPEDEL